MIQNKTLRWITIIVFIPAFLIFMKIGTAGIKSLANYILTKSVVDQGGAASQSTNYKMIDVIGQSGGVGGSSSTNYKEAGGYFASVNVPQMPMLSVTPTTLDFGTTQTSLTFQITNTGSGTLNWSVAESPDKAWITSVVPAGGNGSGTVTVTVDRSLLAGASDSGTIAVTSNGGNANVAVLIQKVVSGTPIYPVAASSQTVGAEFWVDIIIGDNSNPVNDLFGISFDLNFTNTTYVDVVTPHSNNVISVDFIGNDILFFPNVDETAGKVSIGISRKAGQGGVNGLGTVARIKFVSNSGTPDATDVLFSLSNVSANDPNGAAIALTSGSQTVTLGGNLIVWPGDTNNDGTVNQMDILPLGLYWTSTGTARPGASNSWTGQPATPWSPEKATYADATGDGIVNQSDILPIGLNWKKTHVLLTSSGESDNPGESKKPNSSTLRINLTGDVGPNGVFWVEFIAEDVTNLFGISFEMVYSPTTYIDSVKAETSNWLGDDILYYPTIDMSEGKVSFGISKKAGQDAKSGSGVVSKLRMRMKDMELGETELLLQNVVANDHLGTPIAFEVVNYTITAIDIKKTEAAPSSFALFQNYPNPFNPETTIEYNLPNTAEVILTVYNVNGRQIQRLAHGQKEAGNHSAMWNALDESGNAVSSGVYFYQIEVIAKDKKSQSFFEVKKMILMK